MTDGKARKQKPEGGWFFPSNDEERRQFWLEDEAERKIIFEIEEKLRQDKIDKVELCIAQPGTFEWALIQMKAGKKVRRMHWADGRSLSLSMPDWTSPRYIVVNLTRGQFTISDTLEEDWEVVE